MKHLIILATALALGASAPAAAQTTGTLSSVKKIELKGPQPAPAPATTPPAAKAQFGCDARKPAVCNFLIFYARGNRNVVLPAGMKVAIPDARIGKDSYCVAVDKKPAYKCPRKMVNAKYNS
jgi:hypothetical protein